MLRKSCKVVVTVIQPTIVRSQLQHNTQIERFQSLGYIRDLLALLALCLLMGLLKGFEALHSRIPRLLRPVA